MLNRTLQNRIERAEQAAKEQSKFSPECICFPQNEQPFFGFPLEEQIAAKMKCPHHGDRFRPIFHIYVPKWRRDNKKKVRWFENESIHFLWTAIGKNRWSLTSGVGRVDEWRAQVWTLKPIR
jgi:hypothetical protein